MKIIQFQVMPNDYTWQGCILGLGEDGNMYVTETGSNNVTYWTLYLEHPVDVNSNKCGVNSA